RDVHPCGNLRCAVRNGADRDHHFGRCQYRQRLYAPVDRRRHTRWRRIRRRTGFADGGGDRRPHPGARGELASFIHAYSTRLAGWCQRRHPDHCAGRAGGPQPAGEPAVTAALARIGAKPWIWSFLGALLVWLAAIAFTRGYGAGGMVTAALSLAVFSVIVGIGQMFVITLGPGNVDLSLPANIGLASAVAMKTMGGDDRLVIVGLAAAIACGLAGGLANYLLIWALRIPPLL